MTQSTRSRRPLIRNLRSPLLGASTGLLVVACGVDPSEPAKPGYTDPLTLGEVSIQLTRAETCGDLLTGIQEGAVARLEQRLERIRSAGDNGGYGEGYYVDEDFPTSGGPISQSSGTVAVGMATPGDPGVAAPEPAFEAPPPRADTGGNSNDNLSVNGTEEDFSVDGENGNGFSGTTVQVVDIDEADFVKTDGNNLYVLHGGTLLALTAWPADEASIVASALIEGEPTEMFVHEGKAVVFSRIYQNLSAAVEEPSDDESRYYYNDYTGYTKVTVLDISGDGDSPTVVRESFVEGNYTSSRRHDGLVRAVIQDGYKVPALGNPNVEYRDPFGNPYPQADIDEQLDAWGERMTRSIRATELGDWLPREFEIKEGELSAVEFRCNDYYRPDTGLTESGVTSVVALNLDDLDASLGGATILGRAERVYSNKDALVLSQTDYRYRFDEDASAEQTILHRFDIDGVQTGYTASGAVAGRIHNQFSMDERDGVIRVSTTEERWQNNGEQLVGVSIGGTPPNGGVAVSRPAAPVGEPMPDTTEPAEPLPETPEDEQVVEEIVGDGVGVASSAEGPLVEGSPFVPQPAPDTGAINRIVTLRVEDGSLVPHGTTAEFGATERIYATRFMGDRAYVVTFRRTDPLFVVDMSDDAAPEVVGELLIPGFSDYLFPLGENHLFAIGRDANEEGRVRGLALQIFDVSDPTHPALAHRYVYNDNSASPANVDHRAISFHNNGQTVAFPFESYQTNTRTLELFDVSAESGFERLGGLDPAEDVSLEQCLRSVGYKEDYLQELIAESEEFPELEEELFWQCRYNQRFRRAVFRENFVYGVGTNGLYTYDLNAIDAGPVSTVQFPGEVYDYREYGDEKSSPENSGSVDSEPAIGNPAPAPPILTTPGSEAENAADSEEVSNEADGGEVDTEGTENDDATDAE